ncbi:carbohydrate ABC transporter permease [Clostridium oryzae]|uniref:L-arabinose transport system permease protein AraQ n=1 Tax=Clostridium oryzae TaxID=1450648 RepID=A0A1V4IG96_9CLOT|nr:carbohydrate ABC transporter permease [Clostridium oryzae]OPJ58557.1 L-arabinose transport system permease protein AraQ [Clostridium oryzae]
MKTKRTSEFKWHVLLLILIFLSLFPIVFAILSSFKNLDEIYKNGFTLLPRHPTLKNYAEVFKRLPFAQISCNTFIIASTVTIFKTSTAILAAYAFVYYDFKYKNLIYFVIISTIFVPFTVTMIPNYLVISKLGLSDKLFGVILPQLSDATGIFLIRQAMRTIPFSLIEVAELENVNRLKIMRDIVIPLVKPAIISTGIMFFINSWNEYVWPVLILKSKEKYTLPLALQLFISSEGGTDFTIAMAVSVITMIIPLILYIIFQKYIIDTFAASGIKG